MIFIGSNVSNQHVNSNKVQVCIHSPTPNSIQTKKVKLVEATSISTPQPLGGDDLFKTLKDKHNKTTNVPSNVTTAIMIQINCQAANQPRMVYSGHHSSCDDNMAHSTMMSRYRNKLESLICSYIVLFVSKGKSITDIISLPSFQVRIPQPQSLPLASIKT